MKTIPTSKRALVAAIALLTGSAAFVCQAKDISLSAAKLVMAAATEHARALHAPGGAIAIVDAGGSVVLLERLEGSFPAASDVSIGKARTAAAFRKPTRVFEDTVNGGRFTMIAVAQVTHFTPLQGGVPIVIGGEVVGAIGCSGAASAKQDDEIAQFAADAIAKPGVTAKPGATAKQGE